MLTRISVLVVLAIGLVGARAAEQNEWITLFGGKNLDNWTDASGNKPGAGWVIQDGAVVRKSAAGDIWTKQRYGDFALELEFQAQGNSGVFIRTDNPKDNV